MYENPTTISSPDDSDLIMWKESKVRYRFQTNSASIKKKMRGRKTFSLVAYGVICPLEIYVCSISCKRDAIKRFKSLTGRDPTYCSKDEIYY